MDTGDDTGIITEENATKCGEEGLYRMDNGQNMDDKHRETKRTERIPVERLLGALAPMPLPVAIAPPGMIGWKVLCEGGRRERWVR